MVYAVIRHVLVLIIVKMIQLIAVVQVLVKVIINVQLVYMIHQREFRVKMILVVEQIIV